MPLPELLALYGFRASSQKTTDSSSLEDDAEPMEEQEGSETEPQDQSSQLQTLYDCLPDGDQDASRVLPPLDGPLACCLCWFYFAAISRVSEEEEEDYDYSPDESEWRKVNKVTFIANYLLHF